MISLGGPFVIFTPFCWIETRKYAAGALVRNKRKAPLFVLLPLSPAPHVGGGSSGRMDKQ